MKRIGLLGGMSWESSADYYRLINEDVRRRLGGLHSADCVLRSVDFADIEKLQAADEWDQAGVVLAVEASSLEAAGAEILVLSTNTRHKVAAAITDAIDIPLLHIADATADAVQVAGMRTVGLLATGYTMEQEARFCCLPCEHPTSCESSCEAGHGRNQTLRKPPNHPGGHHPTCVSLGAARHDSCCA